MGRDLTLYPDKATKKELKEYIESFGFQKCQHLWDWPKGTLNYSWFEVKDFKSIDGVLADIYPLEGEDLSITGNKWALHVRNVYSASYHDVLMLNQVLREARKRFGGTIHGDYGKNRYAPLWEDNSTPVSRGVKIIYKHVIDNIRCIKQALPEPLIKPREQTDDLFHLVEMRDPSRVIYNGLIPFAVAMIEYFFSETFQILLKYDERAAAKVKNHKQKVEFNVLLDVSEKQKSIESVISENYTFQNIDKINKAFKDWIDIDIREILYKKRRIGKSVLFLQNRISDIIQDRHGIVHRFEIDYTLSKDGYVEILDAIEHSINEVIEHIEKKYTLEIKDRKLGNM
jgi:hypothetical protein